MALSLKPNSVKSSAIKLENSSGSVPIYPLPVSLRSYKGSSDDIPTEVNLPLAISSVSEDPK